MPWMSVGDKRHSIPRMETQPTQVDTTSSSQWVANIVHTMSVGPLAINTDPKRSTTRGSRTGNPKGTSTRGHHSGKEG